MLSVKYVKNDKSSSLENFVSVKGYIRFAGVVAGPHALDRLHHAGVGPAAPAAGLVTFVTHCDFQTRQHSARQERSHAGQTEPKRAGFSSGEKCLNI